MVSTSAKMARNINNAFIKLVQITPRTGVEYKIAVLGAGGVGKSAITVQFIHDSFVDSYVSVTNDKLCSRVLIAQFDRTLRLRTRIESKSWSQIYLPWLPRLKKVDYLRWTLSLPRTLLQRRGDDTSDTFTGFSVESHNSCQFRGRYPRHMMKPQPRLLERHLASLARSEGCPK